MALPKTVWVMEIKDDEPYLVASKSAEDCALSIEDDNTPAIAGEYQLVRKVRITRVVTQETKVEPLK